MNVPIAPLFVPGDRPDRFAKAAASDADAVIVDLEDAVADANKATARQSFRSHAISGKPVIVRINAATSAHWAADLALLQETRPRLVMLPKAENVQQVEAVLAAAGPQCEVIVLIETALGLEESRVLCAHAKVLCAAFGALDYAADVGASPGQREVLATARALLVLRARAAGSPAPLDGITTTVSDLDLVGTEAADAASFGFGGKLAIHPAQTGVIHRAFAPHLQEVVHALRLLAAAGEGGVARFGDQMVDGPVLRMAQRVTTRASAETLAEAKAVIAGTPAGTR